MALVFPDNTAGGDIEVEWAWLGGPLPRPHRAMWPVINQFPRVRCARAFTNSVSVSLCHIERHVPINFDPLVILNSKAGV